MLCNVLNLRWGAEMVERNGSSVWDVPNLSGIQRNDIGPAKLYSDIGDWFFTEPGSGWEHRVKGYLGPCWMEARMLWHRRKGAMFGIIDCIKLE